MSKRKNITAIPLRVKDLLHLSTTQKQKIEAIENELQEIYESGKLKSNGHFLFISLRKFLPVLSQEQIHILKQKRDEQKLKNKKRKEEKYERLYKTSEIKFKDLQMSQDQLEKYVEVKMNWLKLSTEKMKEAKNLDEIFDKAAIEKENIYPIFNTQQLSLYKDIILQDKKKEKLHLIKMEKSRFNSLYDIELTEKQAAQLFDKNPMIPRKDEDDEYYSEFEEIELRLQKIKSILTPEQLKTYLPKHQKEVQNLENRYKKSNDEEHLEKLNDCKDSLNNYINNILPLQCAARQRLEKFLSAKQKELIENLRRIYFPMLDEQFIKLKALHYRYHRDFCPNELEVYAISDKLNRINPNGNLLRNQSIVSELMTPELIEIVKEEKEKINPLFDRVQYIHHEEFEPEEGTVQIGWNIRLQRKKGDEHLKNLGLLLLEPNIAENLKKINIE